MISKPTPQQLNIINTTEGYVRVAAVPGSGKTFALTHRIAHLITDLYISPDSIVALTFTRKAASAMKAKLRGIIGDKGNCFIGTFHSYCCTILKEEIHHLSYPKTFLILDKSDQKKIVKDVLEEMNLSARDYRTIDVLDAVAHSKADGLYIYSIVNHLVTKQLELDIQKYAQSGNTMCEIVSRFILKQYDLHSLDYNDLLHFTNYIFRKYPDILEKWQDKCEYVLVDEYQDVSKTQVELVDMLSSKYQNLFIIGDDDQNIYSWRGSKSEYLIDFTKLHPNTTSFTLDNNFRSTPEIINASNQLILHNTKRLQKKMNTSNGSGNLPSYNCLKTTNDEASWIAKTIVSSIASGSSYKAHAILVRNNSQTRALEEQFIANKIPYKTLSGAEFYSSKEIKTSLAYLSMILNMDDLSFEYTVNTPKRKFGKQSIESVKNYASNNGTTLFVALSQLLQSGTIQNQKVKDFYTNIYDLNKRYTQYSCTDLINMVLDWGYRQELQQDPDQSRLDNVAELIHTIYELEKANEENLPLDELLQHFALFTPADDDTNDDKVKIMTIHTAKGLEFDNVFVPGLNEGLLPSSKAVNEDSIEEERRLFYVAMTRAKNNLYISSSQYQCGELSSQSISSRFIGDIGEANLNVIHQPIKVASLPAKQPSSPIVPMFVCFQKITVKGWGDGIILEVDEINQKYKIKFDQISLPKNISFTADIKSI